jgi:hypothetical protein
MSFPTLAKSYKGLWIVKAEPKNLGVSLGAVISLETSVPSTWSNMLASHWMTRKRTCAQPSGVGPQNPNHLYALA